MEGLVYIDVFLICSSFPHTPATRFLSQTRRTILFSRFSCHAFHSCSCCLSPYICLNDGSCFENVNIDYVLGWVSVWMFKLFTVNPSVMPQYDSGKRMTKFGFLCFRHHHYLSVFVLSTGCGLGIETSNVFHLQLVSIFERFLCHIPLNRSLSNLKRLSPCEIRETEMRHFDALLISQHAFWDNLEVGVGRTLFHWNAYH